MYDALEVSLEMVAALRPVIGEIEGYDEDLAGQLRGAASAVALDLAKADGGRRLREDRLLDLDLATSSAIQVRTVLRIATAWRYVSPLRAAPSLELVERVIATIARADAGGN